MSYWLWLSKHQLKYKELHSTELTNLHSGNAALQQMAVAIGLGYG